MSSVPHDPSTQYLFPWPAPGSCALLALILTRIYVTMTRPGFYREVGKRFRFETAQHPRPVDSVGRLLNCKYPPHGRSHLFCFFVLYVGFSEMRPRCLAQFHLRLTILPVSQGLGLQAVLPPDLAGRPLSTPKDIPFLVIQEELNFPIQATLLDFFF